MAHVSRRVQVACIPPFGGGSLEWKPVTRGFNGTPSTICHQSFACLCPVMLTICWILLLISMGLAIGLAMHIRGNVTCPEQLHSKFVHARRFTIGGPSLTSLKASGSIHVSCLCRCTYYQNVSQYDLTVQDLPYEDEYFSALQSTTLSSCPASNTVRQCSALVSPEDHPRSSWLSLIQSRQSSGPSSDSANAWFL